jgi:acetolactate synthase-1/2/3 large subunit
MSQEDVVGWGRELAHHQTVSLSLAVGLRDLGVEEVFTVVGGGVAPLADALQKCKLKMRHFRHEGGAAFAAHEASVASGRPVAVCVTTGPGLYNALTGMAAARTDGGRVILLSGATSPSMRGKGAVQETSPETMPSELFTAGNLFHFARIVADASELPVLFARLKGGLQRAGGFIAHLALPLSLQGSPGVSMQSPEVRTYEPRASTEAIEEVISLLKGRRFGVWAGYGAISASREVRALVARTGCSVIATPRAKGVFPENQEGYIGVSGAGAHLGVAQYMKEYAPEYLLVLGSRLGEVSSFWSPVMIPSRGFIQVDLDESAFGAGYPGVPTTGVKAEIRSFLTDLLSALPADLGRQGPTPSLAPMPKLTPRGDGDVRTPFLLQEIQRIIVDGSDSPVMAESGNSFAWANHALRFGSPYRYRTSAAFGSMGHFVTGVVGAALVRGKAVVIAGDGAMLMNNEINTAVTYGAKAVWIVLNDARFGLTEHGMQALSLTPVETQITRTDFAMFAQSQGAKAVVVHKESELAGALQEAMRASVPFVVDVRIDQSDFAPLLASRIASLKKQRGEQ